MTARQRALDAVPRPFAKSHAVQLARGPRATPVPCTPLRRSERTGLTASLHRPAPAPRQAPARTVQKCGGQPRAAPRASSPPGGKALPNSWTAVGLKPDTLYTFTVAATNSKGAGKVGGVCLWGGGLGGQAGAGGLKQGTWPAFAAPAQRTTGHWQGGRGLLPGCPFPVGHQVQALWPATYDCTSTPLAPNPAPTPRPTPHSVPSSRSTRRG